MPVAGSAGVVDEGCLFAGWRRIHASKGLPFDAAPALSRAQGGAAQRKAIPIAMPAERSAPLRRGSFVEQQHDERLLHLARFVAEQSAAALVGNAAEAVEADVRVAGVVAGFAGPLDVRQIDLRRAVGASGDGSDAK